MGLPADNEAEAKNDAELVRAWLVLLFYHIGETNLEMLRENRLVREIRAIAKKTKADEVTMDYDAFRIPTEDDSYVPASVGWWFDLSQDP